MDLNTEGPWLCVADKNLIKISPFLRPNSFQFDPFSVWRVINKLHPVGQMQHSGPTKALLRGILILAQNGFQVLKIFEIDFLI